MKTIIYSIIIFSLLFLCFDRLNRSIDLPKNATLKSIKLKNGYGTLKIFVPDRYDTSFVSSEYSREGKMCDNREYWHQPKEYLLPMKNGCYFGFYNIPPIERFEILHSSIKSLGVKINQKIIQNSHLGQKESYVSIPDMYNIIFDTITVINNHPVSIYVSDLYRKPIATYSKKVIAFIRLDRGDISLTYELFTKQKDSITDNFIKNSLDLIRTIEIE